MSTKIKYGNLFSRLNQEFSILESLKLVNRIRKFSKKNLEALAEYMETGIVPELSDGETTLSELIDGENMSPLFAFIMIDWMEKKPEDAYLYMSRYRYDAPFPELTDMQKEFLKAKLERFKKEGNIQIPEEEPNETDIEIPEETSVEDVKMKEDTPQDSTGNIDDRLKESMTEERQSVPEKD